MITSISSMLIGLVIGFLAGAYTVRKQWNRADEERRERIIASGRVAVARPGTVPANVRVSDIRISYPNLTSHVTENRKRRS